MKNPSVFAKYGYVENIIPFFTPESIAILYADNEIARIILKNLIQNPFGGVIYPVHKEGKNILGIPTYTSLKQISDTIDLVIITENYPQAFTCIHECIENSNKIKAILMLSFGFREDSSVYNKLKKHFIQLLKKENIRIIGPNSTGILSSYTNLNISTFSYQLQPGSIAFLTQSGSLGSSILDWSFSRNIGFSAFVSIGSSIDVSLGELIDYFGHDSHTKSIIIYLETLRNPGNFISAVREISLSKPIIVLKAGKYKNTQEIIKRKSGHIINHNLLDAIFRRSGVISVESIEELFFMAEILSEQEIPKNNRLAIISNGTGTALLATDKYIDLGGKIIDFEISTKQQLKNKLKLKNIQNPLIISIESNIETYLEAISIIEKDSNQDGIVLILSPASILDLKKLSSHLVPLKQKLRKPLLVCIVGGNSIKEAVEILRNHHIPVFDYPDLAVKIFYYMYKYFYSIRGLYETPNLIESENFDYLNIISIINKNEEKYKNQNKIILNKEDSLSILKFSNFKVNPETSIHKFNAKMGMYSHNILGPILYFKILSNTVPIKNFGLPPQNTTIAKRMIENSQNFEYIKNNKPLLYWLEILLVQLSNLILEFPKIQYIHLNIVIDNIYEIFDAKIILYSPDSFIKKYKPPVIRPYPKQYIEPITLKNNQKILIRPIKPEDESLIIKFHYELSERSVYQRYLQPIELKHRITHERLIRICFIDYDREMAIIAIDTKLNKVLGVGRLSHHPYKEESEFAVLIADPYQGLGLGTKILSKLLEIGKKEKKSCIFGIILKENHGMLQICKKLGFSIQPIDEELVKAEIFLK